MILWPFIYFCGKFDTDIMSQTVFGNEFVKPVWGKWKLFRATLNIAMEEKYDVHCTRLSKMRRPIMWRRCLMPWYSLFSPYSTRKTIFQTKQFCSIYSSFHGTWGHAQSEKWSRKPSVKNWNFTHGERRKRQNKYTRLELKYYYWYCWVACNSYFHLEMYCLRSISWPNLASSIQGLQSRKLVDDTAWTTQIWRVCFVPKDGMSH